MGQTSSQVDRDPTPPSSPASNPSSLSTPRQPGRRPQAVSQDPAVDDMAASAQLLKESPAPRIRERLPSTTKRSNSHINLTRLIEQEKARKAEKANKPVARKRRALSPATQQRLSTSALTFAPSDDDETHDRPRAAPAIGRYSGAMTRRKVAPMRSVLPKRLPPTPSSSATQQNPFVALVPNPQPAELLPSPFTLTPADSSQLIPASTADMDAQHPRRKRRSERTLDLSSPSDVGKSVDGGLPEPAEETPAPKKAKKGKRGKSGSFVAGSAAANDEDAPELDPAAHATVDEPAPASSKKTKKAQASDTIVPVPSPEVPASDSQPTHGAELPNQSTPDDNELNLPETSASRKAVRRPRRSRIQPEVSQDVEDETYGSSLSAKNDAEHVRHHQPTGEDPIVDHPVVEGSAAEDPGEGSDAQESALEENGIEREVAGDAEETPAPAEEDGDQEEPNIQVAAEERSLHSNADGDGLWTVPHFSEDEEYAGSAAEPEPSSSQPQKQSKKPKTRKSGEVDGAHDAEPKSASKSKVRKSRKSAPSLLPSTAATEDAPSTPAPKKSRKRRASESYGGANLVSPAKGDAESSNKPAQRRRKGNDEGLTGVERALKDIRELGNPPDLRSSGEFSSDERELLRRAITAHMFEYELSHEELVDMIQFTAPTKFSESSDRINGESSDAAQKRGFVRAFWKNTREALPARGTTSIQRFVRRQYHKHLNSGGKWTQEEDSLLKELQEKYPNQWTKIAGLVDTRSSHDCYDRWRNYVKHDGDLKRSRWSEEEEDSLRSAVAENIALLNAEREASGLSLADYDVMNDINWASVSQKMNDKMSELMGGRAEGERNRLQCLQKWKQLQNKTEAGPSQPKKPSRKSDPGSEGKKKRSRKSQQYSDSKLRERRPKPEERQEEPELEERQEELELEPETREERQPKQMLWGDKIDLMNAIVDCDFDAEETIVWKDVLTKLSMKWTTKECKAVFRELEGLVEEQDTLLETISEITDWIAENHGDELEERYRPDEGGAVEGGDDVEGAEQEEATPVQKLAKKKEKVRAANHEAGLEERHRPDEGDVFEGEEQAEATSVQKSAKRKEKSRKRKAGNENDTPRTTRSAKRSKREPSFKSNELVGASDDEL
ncbi:hypothetical protein BCR34DRAFT_587111 [Clohesyomyces aquaticus]|uniref:Uncharacterized protein n=1 Tax=Clohesyomyces aquaticus TaxID=1231657 RepID=A0A1Y1ZQZ3_9PLEO|nr:hypothetical protein BCR34DRAFT_587111 [Clohesyomyces aquaticus]